MTAREIELALVNWLSNERLSVPNVSWGLHVHECDILTLSRSGYASEIEIKVSKSDLRRDRDKGHHHNNRRIKYLYFAMPDTLRGCLGDVPEHAGVIIVSRLRPSALDGRYRNRWFCNVLREPVPNRLALKFTDAEAFQLARLGALRIWSLKKRIWELEQRQGQDGQEKDFSI